MDTECFSKIIDAVVGSIMRTIAALVSSHKLNSIRKKSLKKLLENSRYPVGRKLETLSIRTGTSAEECRNLLIEIGAEGIKLKGDVEGWTLKRK